MGMVGLVLLRWQGDPVSAAWRALEILSEGRLIDGKNRLTVLDACSGLHRGRQMLDLLRLGVSWGLSGWPEALKSLSLLRYH